jgi:hypothetical protein
MFGVPLLAATLSIGVAAVPSDAFRGATPLSMQQKNAAVQPLVRSATECIARNVAADPRYRAAANALGDVIVDSMPPCLRPVRAMIEAYDRTFGAGTGEAFFMGPYLDVLPDAVTQWVTNSPTSD